MDQKLTRMASTPHYKSYKDGKHWVTACLTSVALLGAMAIAPKASAATTEASSADDTTPVSDESATATATKQVTLTSPTTDTQSESATADSTTPAAKPDATETDTTVGAETSDATSEATAAKAASAAIDAQQSDKTATKQDTNTTTSQNATANKATTEKKAATTGFTARVGETSNVTLTYVNSRTNQQFMNETQAIPVGTSIPIPVMNAGNLNGQPTILKLVSYSLDGGQPISNFDPTTGPTVTVPDEANTSLQLNVEVNPNLSQLVAYLEQHERNTTGEQMIYGISASQAPSTVSPSDDYDTSGDVTVTVTPTNIGAAQGLTTTTFKINNATQSLIDGPKDPNGNLGTYQQAVGYLAQFGISPDGTVAMPNYMTAAMVYAITFTVPANDKGKVNVSYTHEDNLPLDPAKPSVTIATDGTGKAEISANDTDNGGKGKTADLKQIILKTAGTATTPAREFIYALYDYDQTNNTFNRIFVTMKNYNEKTGKYEGAPVNSNVQGNNGSWYNQMAKQFGAGVPYVNDISNRPADKIVQNLLAKGIGIDGSVTPTDANFLNSLTDVQFVYAGNGQKNPGKVGDSTVQVITTDGDVLGSDSLSSTLADGTTLSYGGMTELYPTDLNQVFYPITDYTATLTSPDGQSITINVPMAVQVVGTKLENLVQVDKANFSGDDVTVTGTDNPSFTKQYFNIPDPSQDSTYSYVVKLLPVQEQVNYIDETGAQLTPTKTLNGSYDPKVKQATYDKLQGADVSLANHGALQRINVENSATGQYVANSPEGPSLGMVPEKYASYIFDSTNPQGDVTVETYNTLGGTPVQSMKLPYAEAIANLKANGLDVDGTVAAPNYFMFETVQGVQFVYAKAAATKPGDGTGTTPGGSTGTTPGGSTGTTPGGSTGTTPGGSTGTTPGGSTGTTPTENNAGGATASESNQGTAPAGNGSTAPADNNETAPEQTAGSNGTATNTAPTATTGNANAAGVTTPTAAKGTQSATANTNKLPQTDERANSSLALLGLSLMGLVGLGAFISRKRRD